MRFSAAAAAAVGLGSESARSAGCVGAAGAADVSAGVGADVAGCESIGTREVPDDARAGALDFGISVGDAELALVGEEIGSGVSEGGAPNLIDVRWDVSAGFTPVCQKSRITGHARQPATAISATRTSASNA